VSTNAANAGVASIPGPMAVAEWDGWFIYEMFGQTMQLGSGVGFEPRFGVERVIDSRAQRKIEDNMSVAVVFENGTNGLGTEVLVNLRLLFKLP